MPRERSTLESRAITRLRLQIRSRAMRAVRREEIARRERAMRDDRKRRLIEHLGGGCVRCGLKLTDVDDCTAVFEFHHRDWRTKRWGLSANLKRAWRELVREIEGCDLVCANCHRRIEAAIQEERAPRGRPAKGWPTEIPSGLSPRRALEVRIELEEIARARRVEDAEQAQWTLFDALEAA